MSADDRTAPGRRGRWRWVVGISALALLLGAAGAVIGFDRTLTRVEVQGLGEDPRASEPPDPPGEEPDLSDVDPSELPEDIDLPELDPEARTILVLGSDSREVLTPEEREELGTGDFWGERTEVVALVRLDPSADRLRLLNVPRDTVVTRCDGSQGRINAAYGIGERDGRGGMTCVVQTVGQWSGLTIDHAVKVDFRGFIDIVDAIGGVEMYLDRALRDRRANLDLPAGCVVLDGADALAFVRARGIDDDFGRIARQQRFLRELRAQIAELGFLSDMPRLLRLTDATARFLELDSTLTLNRIRQLVATHRGQLVGDLETQVVPGEPTISRSTGAYLLRPDEDRAAELFTWLATGVDPAAPPELPDDPVETPEDLPDGAADRDGTAARQQADDRPPPAGSVPQRCDAGLPVPPLGSR